MREFLDQVLRLQTEYSPLNTPEMRQRGQLVRHDIVCWVRERLAWATQDVPEIAGWEVAASDGVGRKSQIPWVRIYSKNHSPSATNGWYVTYLFGGDGGSAYLSLMQGTVEWRNGEFIPQPPTQLRERAKWVSDVLPLPSAVLRPAASLNLNAHHSRLGRSYETGAAAAFEYARHSLPSEEDLANDLRYLVSVLGHLYGLGGQESTTTPERQAVAVAMKYLEENGYTVTNGSAGAAYDLSAKRGGQHLLVKVDGTTMTCRTAPESW